MASIRKRNGKWQVQVRRLGNASQSRTFHSKNDALVWAREMERGFDLTVLVPDRAILKTTTLRDLIERYAAVVTLHKKGRRQEWHRLHRLAELELAQLPLQSLRSVLFSEYRDKRLGEVSNQTVRHELALLRHVLNTAMREWSVPLPQNPIETVRIPPQAKPRNRRLRPGELRSLFAACKTSRTPWLRPTVLLALETGMRRGELLAMRWEDVEESTGTVRLRDTKNGSERIVPLSRRAWRTMSAIRSSEEFVIATTESAISQAWNRAAKRSGIPDLHFHDLRHEAISRFFEKGLSVPEVALISGHHDPRMLFRYTHLRAEDVVRKLG